jgi:predicted esterase
MKYLLTSILCSCCTTICAQISVQHVSRQPYNKYVVRQHNRNSTFYLSEFDKDTALPLIIFVQGSGSASLFTQAPSGNTTANYGHINLTYLAKGKAKLLIVEKPGVNYLSKGDSINPVFDQLFSLQSWTDEIIEAVRYIESHEKINKSRIMIVGHSEGGLVAAKVAASLQTSHFTILSGEGPSQLYSLYKLAQDSTFFYTPGSPTAPLDSMRDTWIAILSDPKSTTKKFWGLSYKRWNSFLQTSVTDQLSAYEGKIKVIQGTDDKNVYPESATVLYTSLLSKGRRVQLNMIAGADHSFKANGKDLWDEVLADVVEWFLGE